MSANVFISYQRLSEELASKLRIRLLEADFDVWQDVVGIQRGDDWDAKIQLGLETSTVMVLLLTDAAIASDEVKAEWMYFRSHKKPILPVLVERCEVPYYLQRIQYIFYYENPDAAINQIVEAVRRSTIETTFPKGEIFISDEAITSVSWDTIRQNSGTISSEVIQSRYANKYKTAYYFPRNDVRQHMHTFLSTKKSVMFLVGKAGTGKSSFICDLVAKALQDHCVLVQDCSDLKSDESLVNHLTEQLHIPPALSRVYKKLEVDDPHKLQLIILDGINEHHQLRSFMDQLQDLMDMVRVLPNVKLLITCRMPIWNSLRPLLRLGSEWVYQPVVSQGEHRMEVELMPFSDAEVSQAYAQYQSEFRLQTSYAELSDKVKSIIRQPLFMKLIASTREGQSILPTTTLRDVFHEYIEKVLGNKGSQSKEYQVMARIVEIMYEKARHEVEKQYLSADHDIGTFIESKPEDPTNPFAHLLNEGVVSMDRRRVRAILDDDIVFFTHERILEYLLSAIVIGQESNEEILRYFNEANNLDQERYFPQLRGAAELAVCFRLLDERNRLRDIDWLRSLAESDLPEVSQFIVNIIQTIDDAGDKKIVNNILHSLMLSKAFSAQIIAMEAAYLLKRDDFLVEMACKSRSDQARDTSVMFIYQRWDYERHHSSLEQAYQIVHMLVEKAGWKSLTQFVPSLSALLGVTFFIASEAVRNRDEVIPLANIYREQVIPNLSLGGFLTKMVSSVVQRLSPVVNYIMRFTIFRHENHFTDLLTNTTTKRTVMDMWFFVNVETLEDYVPQLIDCLSSPNPMVPWLYRGVMMYHLYNKPDVHMNMFIDMFDHPDLNFISRFDVAYSLVFANVISLMRAKSYDMEIMDSISTMFEQLWHEYDEVMEAIDNGDTLDESVAVSATYHEERMEALLSGIYAIEALQQNKSGIDVPGSQFLQQVFESYSVEKRGMRILTRGLEKMAYYMMPEFALHSLLHEDVAGIWYLDPELREIVIESFGKLRAFYPNEIATLINEFDEQYNYELSIFVQHSSVTPIVGEVRSMTNSLWTSAVIIEPAAVKVAGLALFDLARNDSTGKFVGAAIETVMTSLADVEYADAAVTAWFKIHDSDWNAYAKWNIAPDIIERKASIYKHYQTLIESYLSEFGASQRFS